MKSNEISAVELLILAGLALALALATLARLVLVPMVAAALALVLQHRVVADLTPDPTPDPANRLGPSPAPALADLAADLLDLSAVELRRITGTRRKVAKLQMVEAWLAMPI